MPDFLRGAYRAPQLERQAFDEFSSNASSSKDRRKSRLFAIFEAREILTCFIHERAESGAHLGEDGGAWVDVEFAFIWKALSSRLERADGLRGGLRPL